MPERINTYGLEIEKPVSDIETGEPHGVSQKFFKRLGSEAWQRGRSPRYHRSDVDPNIKLGTLSTDLGEQGLDNATNLLETASPVKYSLKEIQDFISLDLRTVQEALEAEGATVINMSIHPLGSTDMKTYKSFVAPKGIYPYLWQRGWDHSAGIGGNAQNSPATGINPEQAAEAVSAMIGFGAAQIALFANSPIAEGKPTGVQESRLLMWDRMMKNATVQGDRDVSKYPDQRFHTIADYMEWMFGGRTGIHFVPAGEGYKTAGTLLTVNGNPSVIDYLRKDEWDATVFGSVEQTTVKSNLKHLESMQFACFAGARIRYGFDGNATKKEFIEALEANHLEDFFLKHATHTYIEGRDPGANFPDRQLHELGENIANSVTIAPSAIQAGVLNNLGEATKILDKHGWDRLGQLREAAINNGLDAQVDGLTARKLTEEVLEVAEAGLDPENRWMLDYPKYVLETGRNGATRAIESLGDDFSRDAIAELVKERNVVVK